MKKLVFLIICFSLYQFSFSQVLEDMDAISPFQEELAAIKKGKQWAFINKEGVKVIDFRDDLVVSRSETSMQSYPMFFEGKCLIKKMIDGVYNYGYIDKNGKTVIEPQFLNATNFMNEHAIIVKLDTSKMGSNSALGKAVLSSKLEEYVINTSGKIVKFLDNSRGYIPSSKEAPKFNSKFIAPNLVAVKTTKGKWDMYKF